MMIGSGIPISQRSAPLPKPMFASITFGTSQRRDPTTVPRFVSQQFNRRDKHTPWDIGTLQAGESL
jgi:hypothetical protein